MVVGEKTLTAYLDSSVLIAFLFKPHDQPIQFSEAQRLVGAAHFDHDFQQVANVIPVYTPDEFLATLPQKFNAE